MAVPNGALVGVVAVDAFSLRPHIKNVRVGIEMAGSTSADRLDLANGIAEPGLFQPASHIILGVDHTGRAHAASLPGDGCAQHARIIALGGDHAGLQRRAIGHGDRIALCR